MFWAEDRLHDLARRIDVQVTPRMGEFELPTSIEDTMAWLKERFPSGSMATLDGAGKGQPEGVVVRTKDRSSIAKIRFEDYQRTLGSR